MSEPAPKLLAIIEFGGYPNFSALYRKLGYEPVVVSSVRKALSILKKDQPAVIVAEFNYQHTFRDRISSLESLLAVVQRLPDTRVVVFYEQEHAHQLQRLRERFPIAAALAHPVDAGQLERALETVASKPLH